MSRIVPASLQASGADARFDIAGGLIYRYEDLFRIIQAESRKINQKAMFVGHYEMNLFEDGKGFHGGFSHRIERVLDGQAFMICKCFEEHVADRPVGNIEIDTAGAVLPIGMKNRAQQTILGLGQGRVFVFQVTLERGLAGLEDFQITNARDKRLVRARRGENYRTTFSASLHERGIMRLHVSPGRLLYFDRDLRQVGEAREEVARQIGSELFNALDWFLPGDDVDSVLYRIGGQNIGVIAGSIRACEIAFE